MHRQAESLYADTFSELQLDAGGREGKRHSLWFMPFWVQYTPILLVFVLCVAYFLRAFAAVLESLCCPKSNTDVEGARGNWTAGANMDRHGRLYLSLLTFLTASYPRPLCGTRCQVNVTTCHNTH